MRHGGATSIMEALSLALWLTAPSPVDAYRPLPAILPFTTSIESPTESAPIPVTDSPVSDVLPTVRFHETSVNPAVEHTGMTWAGDRHFRKNRIETDYAAISGKLTIRDPALARNDPAGVGSKWATEETLKMPVGETLFVFSSVDAECESVEQQRLRWLGRTGVGIKFQPWLLREVQLRGGPGMRYDDADQVARGTTPERSELFVEVTTKLPLPVLGMVNVEYSSTAIAAATTAEREQVRQNLRFALPLSDGYSQFHVGARLRSADTPSPTTWGDRAQLYLGLQLKH